MIKRIIISILLVFTTLAVANENVSRIITRSGTGNSRPDFSICFIDIESGREIYSYNSHKLLKPASNMKLVTTATALDALGSDFLYHTRYGLLGDDLVIIGSGDPLSGDPEIAKRENTDIFSDFSAVLQALRESGITEIKGDLLIDNFVFDDERFHKSWPLDQANRWYQAQISGLSFNNNCVDMIFKPSSVGAKALYELTPNTSYLQITNNCSTVSTGSTAVGATRKHNTNEVTLIGKCRTAIIEPINVTVDRPAAFHGYVLAEYLLRNGIKLEGTLEICKLTEPGRELPAGFRELYSKKRTMIEVVNESNQRSQNMVAESIFKTVGAYAPGGRFLAPGSWGNGREAVIAFLEKIQIDPADFVIDDGSGLSHDNRISAYAFCRILEYMAKTSEFENFRNSLSTPEIGTLAKKNRFSKYKGRLFGKTGYISGVNTLSGYCQNGSGKWIAFSILTNSPAASYSTIDSIVEALVK